ncbi:MAG: hypothetical protein U1F18_09635 [Steroidobacteraceae bacterium]
MSYLYSLYDALVSINVPSDKARAVVDAMERDMLTQLASKSDLENLRVASKADLDNLRVASKADIENLRLSMKADFENHRLWTKSEIDNLRVVMESKLELLRSSMTIRLGSMLVVGLSLLFAALKLT